MNYQQYEQEFFGGLDHGKARLKGIRNAIDKALEMQDNESALKLYYTFMDEDVIHGTAYKATLTFPEYLAFFEKHPEYHEAYNHDIMWVYKWTIGDIDEFWQIPLEQIEHIFSQFKDFCKRFNYSLRAYYDALWSTIENLFEPDAEFCGHTAKTAHAQMLKTRDDNLADCLACQTGSEVYYLINVEKDMERAIKRAKPLLEGKLRCSSQPHSVYKNIALGYFENGDLENAAAYIKKSIRLFKRDFGGESSVMGAKSDCVKVLAFAEPESAFILFKKMLPFIKENENGSELYKFFSAGYYLMQQLSENNKVRVKLNFPFKDDRLRCENGFYYVSELKDYMYEQAKLYAERFDKRNGNHMRINQLNKTYHFEKLKSDVIWEADVPILEYIQDRIDETLPEDVLMPCHKNESDVKFVDGALDGITFYHTEPKGDSLDELENIILSITTVSEYKSLKRTEEYFKSTQKRTLRLVDNVQQFIMDNTDQFTPNDVYRYAVNLTVSSKNAETVKLGLCILEIFSEYNDELLGAIKDLSLCNEFTLFCIWAVRHLENGNDLIFQMAKNTTGWGRIFAVNMIEPETDEIKKWLLEEGYNNNVHIRYSALDCFEKAEVHTLLEEGLTEENFTPVGMLISALLIPDSPLPGLEVYEDAEDILNLYLDNAEDFDLSEDDIKAIHFIGENCNNEDIQQRCIELTEN